MKLQMSFLKLWLDGPCIVSFQEQWSLCKMPQVTGDHHHNQIDYMWVIIQVNFKIVANCHGYRKDGKNKRHKIERGNIYFRTPKIQEIDFDNGRAQIMN